METTPRFLIIFLFFLTFSPTAFCGELIKKTFSKKPYSESRNRQYQVFVPSGYRGEPVPMVMVLHGCKQTEQNMVNETRFKDLAEQENFIVVYPFITSYDGQRNPNCWGFWFNHHIHQGKGETEDLYQIALEVESQFKIDPERRYVTGLSSGAAMAVVMAVSRSEYFAAAGASAGLPYSENSESVGFVCLNPGRFKPVSSVVNAIKAEQQQSAEQRTVPFMAIHSNNDCTVNIKGSEGIRDSWLQRYNGSSMPFETMNCTREGVSCVHKKYGSPSRSIVETVFFNGEKRDLVGTGSHYWVGDNFGEYANPTGPSASEFFWNFFKRHTFSGVRAPSVSISSSTVRAGTTTIDISGIASDDGLVKEVSVRLDGQHPQAAKTATGTNSWSVAFENLPNNAIYTPVVTAMDNQNAVTSVTGTPVIVGQVSSNPPSLTIDNITVSSTCIAVSGAATDSEGLAKVEVELGTRGFKPARFENGRYEYRECGLPNGVYTTKVKATDKIGESTTQAGARVKVEGPEIAMANWLDHMNAGRLRNYSAPCPSVGFGACDGGFQTIFLTHSFNPFALYRATTSNDWYLDLANISSGSKSSR